MQRNFLQIPRKDFVRESKAFSRRGLRLGSHAHFSLENGKLEIECGSVKISLPAQGEWQGIARTSWTVIRSVMGAPPLNDPIPISYAENTLMIGSMSMQCRWSARDQPSVENIDNPTLLDLIALDRLLSLDEAKLRGVEQQVRQARLQYRRRLAKAAEQLEPLGVTESELRVLVESKISPA